MSVVVGPNGSGKSNITDAVLWAMGEQSPLAVRGQSMQDVIFAGAHGVQARSEAEVEVVLDNAERRGRPAAGEISIVRRLNRAGEGEYRVNGARCRLTDVLELLSDTGLGKEMHSVVSQGRVEAIVTSKPRDRRMLIEEAAGLGKHRKRRRRAQLKLARTQDNLDRALDVEREARTRLRPLKRQAEAAELHERLERQTDEALWYAGARGRARGRRRRCAEAEAAAAAARAAAAAAEQELRAVAARREQAEQALSARGSEREGLSNRFYAARSARERDRRCARRRRGRPRPRCSTAPAAARALLTALEAEASRRQPATTAPASGSPRSRPSSPSSPTTAASGSSASSPSCRRGARRSRRSWRAWPRRPRPPARAARGRRRRRGGSARPPRGRDGGRDARAARQRAPGPSSRSSTSSCAPTPAPPAARARSPTASSADPGYELALAAALGPRLRAAVAADLGEGSRLLDRAGRDGGAALIVPDAAPAGRRRRAAGAGAEPLSDHVRADGDGRLAARAARRRWVVDSLDGLDPAFSGVAVTRDGRVWSPVTRELRQVPAGGEDRVLAERNRRDGARRRRRARGAGRAGRAGGRRGDLARRAGRRRGTRRRRAYGARRGAGA